MGWKAIVRVAAYSATVAGGMALMTYRGLGIPLGLALMFFIAPWLSDPREQRRRLLARDPWFVVGGLVTFGMFVVFCAIALAASKPVWGDTRLDQMSDRTRIVIVGLVWVVAALSEWHDRRTKSQTPVKAAQT